MTIITREDPTDLVVRPLRPARPVRRTVVERTARAAAAPARGRSAAPIGGTGVLMSRASHRRKPVTPLATVVLALVAAAITVWLGLVAHFGASGSTRRPRRRPGWPSCRSRRGSPWSSSRSGSRRMRRSAPSSIRSAI